MVTASDLIRAIQNILGREVDVDVFHYSRHLMTSQFPLTLYCKVPCVGLARQSREMRVCRLVLVPL